MDEPNEAQNNPVLTDGLPFILANPNPVQLPVNVNLPTQSTPENSVVTFVKENPILVLGAVGLVIYFLKDK